MLEDIPNSSEAIPNNFNSLDICDHVANEASRLTLAYMVVMRKTPGIRCVQNSFIDWYKSSGDRHWVVILPYQTAAEERSSRLALLIYENAMVVEYKMRARFLRFLLPDQGNAIHHLPDRCCRQNNT